MPRYWFHHVHVIAEDIVKAAQFYENNLGATRLAIREDNVDLDLNGTMIKIRIPRPDPQLVEGVKVTSGVEHFAICTDDLDAAVKDLKSKGVRILQEVINPKPGVRLTYFMGAGEIPIELLELK